MKPKLNKPIRTYCTALFLFALMAGAIFLTAGQTDSVVAAPNDINQCYDATTGSDVVFQMGHFVPYGESDVYQGSTLVVDSVIKGGWNYAFITGNPGEESSLGASTGASTASITAGSGNPSYSQAINFPSVGKYTVLAHGSPGANGKQPVEYTVLQEEISAIPAGQGRLRIVHVAGFDSDLSDLTVDIVTDGGAVLVDNLAYKEQGYADVNAGAVNIRAVDQTGNYIIFDLKQFVVGNGELVTIILRGDGVANDDEPFGLGATMLRDCQTDYSYSYRPLEFPPEYPPAGGQLHFVNLAPSSSNPIEASLQLNMNGVVNPEFDSVAYGQSTGYQLFATGNFTAQIFEPGEATVLDSIAINIEDKKNYTLVATGGTSDVPYQLTLLEDDLTGPASGQSHFRFGNFLSNSPSPSTLNVESEGSGAIDLQDIAYEQTGTPAYQALAAGSYDLRMLNGPTTLIDPQAVTFGDRAIETLFSAGNGVEQPYGVFRITNGGKGSFIPLTTARLYVAHLAAIADTVAETAVTLEINGDVVPDFSQYGDSTGYLTFGSGEQLVEVKSNGSTLASRTIPLGANKDYTLIFSGTSSSASLSPLAEDDNSVRSNTNNGHVRSGHIAPFETSNGFIDVDFVNQNATLADNVVYGTIRNTYAGIAAGSFDLDVLEATRNVSLIDPKPFNLAGGDIVTVLSAGGDSPIGRSVYAIVNGQKMVELELEQPVANLYFANLMALDSNLANTEVTVRVGGETVLTGIEFGESTDGYVGILPGTQLLEIIPSNSTTPILSQEITTEAQKPYQLIAHGDGTNPDLSFRAEIDSPAASQVRISVGNLVPLNVPFFDSVNVFQNFNSIATGLASGELSPTAVDVTSTQNAFQFTTADGTVTLLESLPINVAFESVITVVAAGDGGINQPFGLYAIIDSERMIRLPTTESSGDEPIMMVSQFAPTADGLPPVALRVNGLIVDSDFRFGESTDEFRGNFGNNKIEIVDAATEEVLKVTHSVYLTSGDRYLLFITGGTDDLDLRILGYRDTELRDPAKATVSFLNVAPVAESITNRRMNLVLSEDPEVAIKDVKYTFSGTTQVDPGDYDPIVISPDQLITFVDLLPVTLEANDRIVYVAAGDNISQLVSLYQYTITEDAIEVARVETIIDGGFFKHFAYLPMIAR